MKKIITNSLLSILFLFSCNYSNEKKATGNNIKIAINNKPFTEGIVEMGIFSNDIDLGKIISKIDFSKQDVEKQYEYLLKNDIEVKTIFEVIKNVNNQNPLISLAMLMNISEGVYYIKNKEVLGKVYGFGWNMNNYHNPTQDKGSIYLETLAQNDKIPIQDQKIYSEYKISENKGINTVNAIDFNEFDRKIKNTKQNILGYECDVIIYTPKKIDENIPMKLQKIIVYTSPSFSNTINFTHPFYLEENAGILRLDIYYLNNDIPTLVMKPKTIKEQTINQKDLVSKTSKSIYSINDINWGFKSLAIMMSGWGTIKN